MSLLSNIVRLFLNCLCSSATDFATQAKTTATAAISSWGPEFTLQKFSICTVLTIFQPKIVCRAKPCILRSGQYARYLHVLVRLRFSLCKNVLNRAMFSNPNDIVLKHFLIFQAIVMLITNAIELLQFYRWFLAFTNVIHLTQYLIRINKNAYQRMTQTLRFAIRLVWEYPSFQLVQNVMKLLFGSDVRHVFSNNAQ